MYGIVLMNHVVLSSWQNTIIITIYAHICGAVWCLHMAIGWMGGFSDFVAAVASPGPSDVSLCHVWVSGA